MKVSGAPSVLCVDVGGTSTKVGLFGPSQTIESVDSIPTRGPAPEFAVALCALIARVRQTTNIAETRLAGIGVAVAGFLNDGRDRMVYNSNLPWLENYPLRDRLQQDFSVPVLLEVDSNAATLAEFHLGSGRNSSRFLCVTVGTGVGVGMIVHGQPLRFAYGCMGD